jgi:hypothetical protein
MEINEETFKQGQGPLPAEPTESATFLRARSFDPDALTRALRIAGAALVVASASTFMLQHWQGGNDLIRYAMLVGQSLLLAAAAYFVGLSLREGRSARTFLALVLATMPVSFAVLGGLVYSQFHLEATARLPSYATWIAPNAPSALLAVLGTLVVLVPLAAVSFVALARKEARALTLAFFAANLLVLVPVRQPLIVAALAGLSLIGLLRLELTRFGVSAQLDTVEGKLARIMPFAAPIIMLGRVFHLYAVGPAFVGAVLLIASAGIWLTLGRTHTAWKRDGGAWLAATLGVIGWGMCWGGLVVPRWLHDCSGLLLGLPMAAVFGLAAQRAVKAQGLLAGLATFSALLTTLLVCGVESNSVGAVACIIVGVGVAVWGAAVRALFRTALGSCVALLGLCVQVWLATHHDNVLRWASLSVVGMLLIVGSAYVERNRGRIARFWEQAMTARRLEHEDLAA